MNQKLKYLGVALLTMALCGLVGVRAQNFTPAGATSVQLTSPQYFTTPISATAAVNTQTTLTIPAPAAGLYNYVCTLAYELSSDGTGGALANLVSTSTNFNSFAVKFSVPATVGYDEVVPLFSGTPSTGCAKSAASGTATTFVSPASATHTTFTWYATYYQAP